MKLSPFELKIATSQNENSRHAVDLGMDVGETDIRLSARRNYILYMLFLELKTKGKRLKNGQLAKGALKESQIEWNENFDANFKSKNACRDIACGFLEAKQKILQWLDFLNTL